MDARNAHKNKCRKSFKYKVYSQEFHLQGRLTKHQELHENNNVRFSYYLNNIDCPYEELGCMFRHESAPSCTFKEACHRKLCQFQHKVT